MKKTITYIQKNKKSIILIVALLLFILLTHAIYTNKISYIDTLAHSYILKIRNKKLTNALILITNIASATTLIIITCILLITIKNKKIPLYIFFNLFFSFTINSIAKVFFSRPRPTGINLIEEVSFSYPSGHSMIGMSYYGFIAYLLYKTYKHKPSTPILIFLIILMILLIGFSRIYLGVHYLSDIIGGFLLSTTYLMIFCKNISIEKKWYKWK